MSHFFETRRGRVTPHVVLWNTWVDLETFHPQTEKPPTRYLNLGTLARSCIQILRPFFVNTHKKFQRDRPSFEFFRAHERTQRAILNHSLIHMLLSSTTVHHSSSCSDLTRHTSA